MLHVLFQWQGGVQPSPEPSLGHGGLILARDKSVVPEKHLVEANYSHRKIEGPLVLLGHFQSSGLESDSRAQWGDNVRSGAAWLHAFSDLHC